MLVDQIKKRIIQAMKDRNVLEREILRVALGEIQTNQARSKDDLSEERVQQIIRKMVTNIDEVLCIKAERGDDTSDSEQEKVILESLLPQLWDQGKIEEFLTTLEGDIKGVGNDGQAIGVAMKALKQEGAPVQGSDVKVVVAKIRN